MFARLRTMRALRFLVLATGLAGALLAWACAPAARGARGVTGPLDLEAEEEQLILPPTEASAAALERVQGAALGGNARASWIYAHYLLDLFDQARLGGDAASRRLLLSSLGVRADGAGSEATDRVLDAILVAIDRLTAVDRLHADAQAARTVLELDRHPPLARTELFGRVAQLKAVARGGGPVAANAALRLVAFCERAFRDAASAPAPERPQVLAYCLYPLYDTDPEPYFASDPRRRPPEPAWKDLAAELVKLATGTGAMSSRVAPVGPLLGARTMKFIEERAGLMPTRPDPEALHAPHVVTAEPYDWAPMLHLGDGSKIAPAAELAPKLSAFLAQDGRRTLAVALAATAPASALLAAAAIARSAGATFVELVVGYPQQLEAPRGDYWAGRTAGGHVQRAGVLPLALGATATGTQDRDRPRDVILESDALDLHLVMTASEWRLVSLRGALPTVAAGTEAAASLRQQLARVREAFPDVVQLVVVPSGVSVGILAEAIQAARYAESGAEQFSSIGLGDSAPRPDPRSDLPARIERRATARAAVAPDVLRDAAPLLRRCNQEYVDAKARGAGSIRVELDATGQARVTSGPKDAALRQCVVRRLARAMQAAHVSQATVKLGE